MTFSPIRSKLLAFENTPTKQVVSCEINAWMETKRKNSPKKYLRGRTLYPRPQEKSQKQISSVQLSNLSSLKNRRRNLLHSVTKIPPTEKREQTARAATEQQKQKPSLSTADGKGQKQFKLKLTEVQVSEFTMQTDPAINGVCFRPRKDLPPFIGKSPIINSSNKPKVSIEQQVTFFEKKGLSFKLLGPRLQKGSNLLLNPQAKNLLFQTRRLLSVKQQKLMR